MKKCYYWMVSRYHHLWTNPRKNSVIEYFFSLFNSHSPIPYPLNSYSTIPYTGSLSQRLFNKKSLSSFNPSEHNNPHEPLPTHHLACHGDLHMRISQFALRSAALLWRKTLAEGGLTAQLMQGDGQPMQKNLQKYGQAILNDGRLMFDWWQMTVDGSWSIIICYEQRVIDVKRCLINKFNKLLLYQTW